MGAADSYSLCTAWDFRSLANMIAAATAAYIVVVSAVATAAGLPWLRCLLSYVFIVPAHYPV